MIRRWGGGTRLLVALSNSNHWCGTGSSFVGYYRLICLLLWSSLLPTFRIGVRKRKAVGDMVANLGRSGRN